MKQPIRPIAWPSAMAGPHRSAVRQNGSSGWRPEEDRGRDQRADEPAVKIAGARKHRERKQIRRRGGVSRKVPSDHQRLRADDGAGDRRESERGQRVGVQAFAASRARQPRECRKVGRGEQHPEGVHGEEGRREEARIHLLSGHAIGGGGNAHAAF
jgi:hypothetical protein